MLSATFTLVDLVFVLGILRRSTGFEVDIAVGVWNPFGLVRDPDLSSTPLTSILLSSVFAWSVRRIFVLRLLFTGELVWLAQ